MRKFPVFKSHLAATAGGCFKCGHRLDMDPKDKGFPPGGGRYAQRCPHCGLSTFYDVPEPVGSDLDEDLEVLRRGG